ncbi:MAG TPA: DUF1501 domain-containing protein, partial [Pirellulaceae bacterium]|nr:DUF1501 domain-containing protein [Pirellulaceae bacterium]
MSPTISTPVMASNNRADVAAATLAPAPSRIDALDRRRMLGRLSWGLGAAALASLVAKSDRVHAADRALAADRGLADLPHHRPRAKRVIFLFQSGAPSQVDLFDHKPQLKDRHGEELPESVRRGQRLTTMTSNQATLPIVASPYRFAKHGECGAEISELLPYSAKIVDELCIVRSLHTEAINHDPAITFVQTGSQQPGRPSIGSWIDYALGAETDDLPAFVVGITGGESGDQPLNGRLWGGGFLPAVHQAVKLRGAGSPLLYLDDPPGVTPGMRRDWLARLGELNRLSARQSDAVETARVAAWTRQFELAARMQTAVPDLADLASEPEHTFHLYGDDARKPGTFAANCLL